MQKEHPKYFEALNQHPRLLVGQTVPSPDGEGTEVLRDAADAKDWQDAIKHVLVTEIRDRAAKAMESQSDFLTTVHASIDLFKNNADLVPGTTDFDTDLATRFTTLAEPYEVRVEGKLQGYSVPVQPLVNQLRTQLVAERAAAGSQAAAAGAPAPSTTGAPATQPAAAAAATPPEAPQAGITSKAGGGAAGGEDFSTLFGTIGLPGLQI